MEEVNVEGESTGASPVDVNDTAMRIERAREVYKSYADLQDKPSTTEVWGWYLYGLCSYFIQTVLIPIVFPLIISQLVHLPYDPVQDRLKTHQEMVCTEKEIRLYHRLTRRTVTINGSKFSPLEWTSISWAIGLITAAPILGFISHHLDHGNKQPLITLAATAIGAISCLPTGFFNTALIFPPCIATIVAAITVATASHTRHLGLMIRGYSGPTLNKTQFPIRQGVSSWLSLYSTAAGCLGSAIISSFTYYMLKEPIENEFTSLWVVSIFSGLKWLIGIFHVFSAIRPSLASPTSSNLSSKLTPLFSIFKYPHAIGALAGIFFSSFTSMSIFTGGVIFLVGQLCLKPVFLLSFWLIYFVLPLISMPLLRPLEQLLKTNSVKMQVFGFLLSTFTSGFGFYYFDKNWQRQHLMIFAAIQSISAGVFHAHGRVLLLHCSPSGKEGAFSVWFSWMKGIGMCAGFTLGSVLPGNIKASFGTAFCSAICGIIVLIFGNVSDFGGAVDAGHVREYSERGSPVSGLDERVETKEPLHMETP